MTRIVSSLAEIAAPYDALLVDLWGCVHNGVTAFPDAIKALRGYKAGGGTVCLLTNAPRSRHETARQLVQFGVPEDCYDTITTSGDAARAAMFTGAVGTKVWFMGADHDTGFFDPLNVIDDPVEIEQVPLEKAEGIVCTGPFDPHADPEAVKPQLMLAKQNGLKLICANPDIVVDRGDSREWCAGAVAKLYTEMGGESLYFGKPHPPIYDLARRRLSEIGKLVGDDRILAIGDGILTDIAGAQGEGIDSLFITGGLAREETGTVTDPDETALTDWLAGQDHAPTYSIGALR